MNIKGLNRLFSFDGYRIDKVTFSTELVQVKLRLDGRKRLRCPECKRKVRYLYLKLRQASLPEELKVPALQK